MDSAYELWETRSGNLMDSFDSQEEALSVLAAAILQFGPSYADSIVLVLGHGDESKELASGEKLAEWAMKSSRSPQR